LIAKRIKSVTVRRGGESRLNCPRIGFRVSQAGFDPNEPGTGLSAREGCGGQPWTGAP
jgi:hypothetical protein